MRILISGWRSYVALELIRLLQSHEVYVVDSQSKYISQKSNYIKKCFTSSKPVWCFKGFKNDILKIIKDYNIDVLIPTSEEIFYLSFFKEEIEASNCKFLWEDFTTLRELHSKYDIISKCQWMGITIPETVKFYSKKKLESYIASKSIKNYVIKPEFSRFASQVVSNKFWRKTIRDINIDLKYNSYICQEYIDGLDVSSYSIFNKWDLGSHVSYISQNSYKNGASIAFKTYKNKNILDFLIQFWKTTWFHGQIAFDFKVNNKDVVLLECNPRATNGIHLFREDKNFKETLEKILIQEHIKTSYVLSRQVERVHIIPLVLYIFMSWKLSLLWKIYRLNSDTVYDKNNRYIFWYQLYLFLFYIKKSFLSRKSITEAMTYDIEYDGQTLIK